MSLELPVAISNTCSDLLSSSQSQYLYKRLRGRGTSFICHFLGVDVEASHNSNDIAEWFLQNSVIIQQVSQGPRIEVHRRSDVLFWHSCGEGIADNKRFHIWRTGK